MALYILDLESIKALENGALSAQFDKLLKELVADCDARPGDASERSLVFKVICKPQMNEFVGGCDTVDVRFELSSKIPKRQTRTINMGRKHNNALTFNDLAPDNHRQHTLDEIVPDGGSPAAEEPDTDGDE